MSTKLVIESNFGDGIVAELFKKHLQQTKQAINVEETELTYVKKTGSLIPLNLSLINTGLL